MADRLVDALASVPPGAPLAGALAAVARVTVAHRASGGVYRWEARYRPRLGHPEDAQPAPARARSADSGN
jgi:hypothetical protein